MGPRRERLMDVSSTTVCTVSVFLTLSTWIALMTVIAQQTLPVNCGGAWPRVTMWQYYLAEVMALVLFAGGLTASRVTLWRSLPKSAVLIVLAALLTFFFFLVEMSAMLCVCYDCLIIHMTLAETSLFFGISFALKSIVLWRMISALQSRKAPTG